MDSGAGLIAEAGGAGLGVAVGGCTLDAAASICGDADTRLDEHLRSLAEKHLVQWTATDDGPRILTLPR